MALATMKRQTQLRDPAQVPLATLAEQPKYQALRAELAAIEQRLGLAEQRRKVALARARGQQPTRSAAQRAEDLVAGGTVMVLSPAAELEAAEEELGILHKARIAKNEQLQALAGELSAEACKQFAAQHAEALRAAAAAATALHDSLEVARVIRGRLIGAGYQLNEAAMPVHMFPAAAALGDPERVGMTPAAQFKSWLTDKGIL